MNDDQKNQIAELRNQLSSTKSLTKMLELAGLLAGSESSRSEARELCFKVISEDPANTLGRLLLARLFYLDNLHEFSVRELLELRRISESPAVLKLISAFGPYAEQFSAYKTSVETTGSAVKSESTNKSESVIADLDLSADFLDAIDEI